MSPPSVARSPIPFDVRRAVEKDCETAGYWWPPDLLDAIVEGRKKYHPIDASLSYPVDALQRQLVVTLLDRNWPTWRDAAPPARTRT